MVSRLPRECFDSIAAALLDFGSLIKLCKPLWPEVARYPRTSSWQGSLISKGMHQLTLTEPWDDVPSSRLRRLIILAGLQIYETEAFIATSKSTGCKILQFVSDAVNALECHTEHICVFLARNNSSLLLSCVLKGLSLKSLDRLNGNHPRPDRYSGSPLGPRSKGNLLHVAVAWRAVGVVRVLLDVFKKNHMELDLMDSIAETPLFLAVKVGNEQIVSMLLEAGADVNTMSGCAYLDKIGKDLDTDYYNAVTPLTVACFLQNINMMKLLLRHGADPNAGNGVDLLPSPLMALMHDFDGARQSWSVSRARETLTLMINSKAEVNGRPGHIDAISPFRSSVYVAARDPWRGILDLLLQRRGDVNTTDDFGDGPLHVAVNYARSDSVQQLLDNGADIYQEDGDGVPAVVALTIQGWKHRSGVWQQKKEWTAPFAARMGLNVEKEEDEDEEDETDGASSNE